MPEDPPPSPELVVREVPAAATAVLRQRVLRPDVPPDPATWAALDVAGAATYAVLAPPAGGGDLVPIATVTVLPEACPSRPEVVGAWRLRGMATDDGWRGRGVGRLALDAAVAHVAAQGAPLLWCNARLVAVSFYARAGFTIDGPEFDIAGIGPHHEMSLALR